MSGPLSLPANPETSGGIIQISAGIVSSNLLIGDDDTAIVSSAGLLKRSTISGGWALIQGGGRIEDSDILANGGLLLSSGALASGLTIGENGQATIFPGAELLQAEVTDGGLMTVQAGARVTDLTLTDQARLRLAINSNTELTATCGSNHLLVSRGCLSDGTISGYGNNLELADGGKAINLAASDEAQVTVYEHGSLTNATFGQYAELFFSGGYGSGITLARGANAELETGQAEDLRLDGTAYVSQGFKLNHTRITSGGRLILMSDSQTGDAIIENGGQMRLYGGAKADQVFVASAGQLRLEKKATVNSATVSGGTLIMSAGASLGLAANEFSGLLQAAEGAVVTADHDLRIVFDLTNRTESSSCLINNLDAFLVAGEKTFSLVLQDNQTSGHYHLAAHTSGSDLANLSVTCGDTRTTLAQNSTLACSELLFISLQNDNTDNLYLSVANLADLANRKTTLAWQDSSSCNLALQMRTGESFSLTVAGGVLDCYNAPSPLNWQVTRQGEIIKTASALPATNGQNPQILYSVADQTTDLFFATASTTWDGSFCARHQGSPGWSGTGESALIADKNRIDTMVWGSSDTGILCLTDDGNGDAFFLDDFFTDSLAGLGTANARCRNLDRILAGAGDDVIDLTSQRFALESLSVHGGDGNDIIWANSGSNILFGDAGNDRITGGSGNDIICGGSGNDTICGGGGDDIICFGQDWGKDTVSQIGNGSLTLVFDGISESDLLRTVDKYGRTVFACGENSVTVKNLSGELNLAFAGQITEELTFSDLERLGAFQAETSNRLFATLANA